MRAAGLTIPHGEAVPKQHELGLSLEEASQLLSSAGLAEANLFVRPSATLSSRQFYRLGMALALAMKPELLVIDEFCESLDDFAAAAVCRRLTQKVRLNFESIREATCCFSE